MSSSENNTEKKRFGKMRIFLITVISGIIIGVGLAVVFLIIRTKDSNPSSVMKSDVASEVSDTDDKDGNNTPDASKTDSKDTPAETKKLEVSSADVSGIVDSVMPSVVSVKCTQVKNYSRDPWEDLFYFEDFGYNDDSLSGTGFIIGQNGSELLIATNNDVPSNAEKVSITFCDGIAGSKMAAVIA